MVFHLMIGRGTLPMFLMFKTRWEGPVLNGVVGITR
jgi:hypothetical protein